MGRTSLLTKFLLNVLKFGRMDELSPKMMVKSQQHIDGSPSKDIMTAYGAWSWTEGIVTTKASSVNCGNSPGSPFSGSSPEYNSQGENNNPNIVVEGTHEVDMGSRRYHRGSSAEERHRRGRPRADALSNLMMQGSTSPSSIKCTFCNRVFPREKSLQAHLRTHTG